MSNTFSPGSTRDFAISICESKEYNIEISNGDRIKVVMASMTEKKFKMRLDAKK